LFHTSSEQCPYRLDAELSGFYEDEKAFEAEFLHQPFWTVNERTNERLEIHEYPGPVNGVPGIAFHRFSL
jgi:hypothetical protein